MEIYCIPSEGPSSPEFISNSIVKARKRHRSPVDQIGKKCQTPGVGRAGGITYLSARPAYGRCQHLKCQRIFADTRPHECFETILPRRPHPSLVAAPPVAGSPGLRGAEAITVRE